MRKNLNRAARRFVCVMAALSLASVAAAEAPLIGPLVGHVDAHAAILWARLPAAGAYHATATPKDESAGAAVSVSAEATAATDLTARWRFSNLQPDARYRYEVRDDAGALLAADQFRTAPADDQPARVSLAFGSCADEGEGSRAVWNRMMAEDVNGVVLGGDTPYIDKTDLATQRRRYREFAAVPEYQRLLATRPHWGTWDDHDFGRNDADGTLPGKENSRQAFMEYRTLPSYGEGNDGIYTSFRWGPIEVFLIDARWWSWTGPSFADPQQKTLLGEMQWRWLQQALAASTAPFKILATGIIWDDKQNKEKDDWETYAHERQALFDYIRRERIGGVVLFGGDIHVTRVLNYPAEATVGYPLHQFISSPIHGRVLPALNVPHPGLIHAAEAPNTFLKLTADSTRSPARLTAEFIDRDGRRLFDPIELRADELTPE